VDGEIQVYFIHNPNTVDIDIDAITGMSSPPAGVGGDANFSLSNLDRYVNTLLELRETVDANSYERTSRRKFGLPGKGEPLHWVGRFAEAKKVRARMEKSRDRRPS
jgi:hypothetical protein